MNEVEEGKAVREGLREALRQLQPFSLQEVENNQAKFLTPFSLLLRFFLFLFLFLFSIFSLPFFLSLNSL